MVIWNQSRTCSDLRGDQFGQRSNLLAAVGQEGDILIGLQALALEHVE